MNWQILVVAIIVFLALLYIGKNIRRKVKAFQPKPVSAAASCGSDCGCSSSSEK